MDKKLEKLSNSLALIEEKTIILFDKQRSIKNIKILGELTYEARSAVAALGKNFDKDWLKLKEKYKQISQKCQVRQLQMLYILEKFTHLHEKLEQKSLVIPKIVLQPAMDEQSPAIKQTMISETPMRMKLTDYENSPFITRKKQIQLEFLDFEANISPDDFSTIPSYMKGRESLDELRAFLEQIVISCFTEKYTLLYKKREAIRNPHDVAIWKTYRQQKDDFPGKFFITEGDLARKIGRLVDKKMSAKLQMLRHLNVIKEIRKIKTVYYIWNL